MRQGVGSLEDAIDSYRSRSRLGGPEGGLIRWFLRACPIAVPRECSATVFLEPRLESGFPDLVIVIWEPSTADSWPASRELLTNRDLQLVQLLLELGTSTEAELASLLGRRIRSSMERLAESEVTARSRGVWRVRSLRSVFAVREIIALEAKVGELAAVVRQAQLNTWFASRSYVLVPGLRRRAQLVALAKDAGVGVWTGNDSPIRLVKAPRMRLPRSFASWLFNEWTWRAARQGEF